MSARPIDPIPAMRASTFTWTRFYDHGASRKAEITQTFDELVRHIEVAGPFSEKSKCWWIKLAIFGDVRTDKGSLRHDVNITEVTGVEADYDGEQIQPEEAIDRLERAGIRAVVYTSPSSRPDAPRWRVLAPLSRPHPPKARTGLLARVNGVLGGIVAPESFVLSQAYYYGRLTTPGDWRVLVTFGDAEDGTCVDELPELDAQAIGKSAKTTPKPSTPYPGTGEPVRFTDAEDRIAKLGRKLRAGDGRRALLMSYAASISARGLGKAEVRVLVDAFIGTYFDPQSPLGGYGIDAVVAWVTERDERKRSELKQVALGQVVRPDSEGEVAWSELLPLTSPIESHEYPLDALPPIIRDAVAEVAAFVQAPIPLVITSALATASVAVQGYADVRRANFLQGPCGLYLLAIADSGERKSTCDGYFSEPIKDYDRRMQEAAKVDVDAFKAAHGAWEAERDGLLAAIKATAKSGKSTDELKGNLAELQRAEPAPPRVPRLLYGDATPEALSYKLAKEWPVGGVLSAEGGAIFGSHGMGRDSVMRNLAGLNQLWDGSGQPVDRRTSESYRVTSARLTVALQVQGPTLREFSVRSGALARGTGFFARFLISQPESTQGTRLFREAPPEWPAVSLYRRRIAEILERPMPIQEDGSVMPPVIGLSPAAKNAWIDVHDSIELALSRGGELYDVRDVASKAADNVARLACIFHVLTGGVGAVSEEYVAGAARIVAWHLNESLRFFGELALPVELANAARLEQWLVDRCRAEGLCAIRWKGALQYGPVRKADDLRAALRELAERGRARLVEAAAWLIEVNPLLLEG
jgi:putative DNA primase/helicase